MRERPTPSVHRHYERPTPSTHRYFELPDAVDDAVPVSFTLSIRQRNVIELKRLALAVSEPSHPSYGKFASASEVAALTAPAAVDIDTVSQWLRDHQIGSFVVRQELVKATMSVSRASKLLNTTFTWWRGIDAHIDRPIRVLRAAAFSLPERVARVVEASFGLHGLPLPPQHATPLPLQAASGQATPLAVTPSVISTAYRIGCPLINGSGANRQAIVEFEGQRLNLSDLATFFRVELPHAQPDDAKVSRFVGAPYVAGDSIEAALDAQYAMGVAPGVKTDVWSWDRTDFCGSVLAHVTALLHDAQPPLVSSVSYGYQGNLADLGCRPAEVQVVDTGLAKLAFRGLTVVVASGDWGSGYQSPSCSLAGYRRGVAVVGDVLDVQDSSLDACCSFGVAYNTSGWTWMKHVAPASHLSGAPPVAPPPATAAAGMPLSNHTYTFRRGALTDGNSLGNGSWTLDEAFARCTAHARCVGVTFDNHMWRACAVKRGDRCHNIYLKGWLSLNQNASWSSYLKDYTPPPPPPPLGVCTSYRTVRRLRQVSPTDQPFTFSGGPVVAPRQIELWPSWPASSPWVTAVGATRFIDQRADADEMASDAFGSGGGFSALFDRSDAPWQAAAAEAYLGRAGSLPKFPPSAAIPSRGRATPDVSLLGEGFRVCISRLRQAQSGCQWASVASTSASTPAFAAMVSLLNEARLQAGQPPMGCINPFLYAHAGTAFRDVTHGTNAIGHVFDQPVALQFGYAATVGWDAATGLGTPRFDKLLAAATTASWPRSMSSGRK